MVSQYAMTTGASCPRITAQPLALCELALRGLEA